MTSTAEFVRFSAFPKPPARREGGIDRSEKPGVCTVSHGIWWIVLLSLFGFDLLALRLLALGPPTLQIQQNGSSQVLLSLSNPIAETVQLESSPDLIHWHFLLSTSNNLKEFSPGPVTNGNRFYRASRTGTASQTNQFTVSLKDQTATVGAGDLVWSDGSVSHFSGGQVRLMAERTNYLVVNYGSLRLHNLRRWIGDGDQLIATIVAHTSAPPQIQVPVSFAVPSTRLGLAKAKMVQGTSPIRVATMGDSLTEISPFINWRSLLFDSNLAAYGYHLRTKSDAIVLNLGASATTCDYGLAMVSQTAQSCGRPCQGSCFAGTASDFGIDPESLPQPTYPLASESHLWSFRPDVVMVAYGINGGPYSLNNLESISRALIEDHQVPTLFLTENDFASLPLSDSILPTLRSIRAGIGGAIADTAAYVEEVNRNGTNTFVDAIHQNDDGWMAWAEAIQGVLNPHAQSAITVPISKSRVVPDRYPCDKGYLNMGATVVGGIPLELSSGVHLAKSGLLTYPGYLPSSFQASLIAEVPGKAGVYTNYVTYSHHCWNWASLIIERGIGVRGSVSNGFHGHATNSFRGYCSWLDESGREHFIADFGYTDDDVIYPRPGTQFIAAITQVLAAVTNQISAGISGEGAPIGWTSSALRISITEGNARIIGVLFGGPRHEELDLTSTSKDFDQPNLWSDESGVHDLGLSRILYTDNRDAPIGIPFTTSGIQLLLRSNPNGGVLQMKGDGVQLADVNLLSTTTSPRLVGWFPDEAPEKSRHQLVLNLGSSEESGLSPGPGLHGVSILKATLIY